MFHNISANEWEKNSKKQQNSRLRDVSQYLPSLFSWEGRYRVLHLTWVAFFLSFLLWFNFVPFLRDIRDDFSLERDQLISLFLCNFALTILARVYVGMVIDWFGPRRVYGGGLILGGIVSLFFASATSFTVLVFTRLILSLIGASLVVGVRMISEWFPVKELGTAEGVYGGWGNVGACAAMIFPLCLGLLGDDGAWRWSIGATGLAAFAYGLFYLRAVSDTPDEMSYARSRRQGALEVTSRSAVFGLTFLFVPLFFGSGLFFWELERSGLISAWFLLVIIFLLTVLFAFQIFQIFAVNQPALENQYPLDDQYSLRSVAILCAAYFCASGAELAILVILPSFLSKGWEVSFPTAIWIASIFTFTNCFARPLGGFLSDVRGMRRTTLRRFLLGLLFGFLSLFFLDGSWPLGVVASVLFFSSCFVHAVEGSVFALAPLLKKRVGGQVAGLVGAYGVVGTSVFLMVYALFSDRVFFLSMIVAGVISWIISFWLPEPENSFAENLLRDTSHLSHSDPPTVGFLRV